MTRSYNVLWRNGTEYTAIVAKDTGGAELLSSYIKQYNKGQFIFYLTGPAIEVFKRKNIICDDYIMSPEWNQKINYLITAVSLQDDISDALFKKAKEGKVEPSEAAKRQADLRRGKARALESKRIKQAALTNKKIDQLRKALNFT